MLWIIMPVSFIVGVISGVSIDTSWSDTPKKVAIIAWVIFVVSTVSAGAMINIRAKETVQTKTEIQIVSLADGQKTKGGGGLFYLEVWTADTYAYYYQLKDGGYKRDGIPSDPTTIYEEEKCERPRIEVHEIKEKFYGNELSGIFLFQGDDVVARGKEYKVYVPKGSIARQFELDAKQHGKLLKGPTLTGWFFQYAKK